MATSIKPRFIETTYTPPEDVKVEVVNGVVKVTGKLGTTEEDLSHTGAEITMQNGKIYIKLPGSSRRSEALLGTVVSKIKNLVKGVTEGYTYRLKIISSHFPITVKVEKDQVVIENFLGERYQRKAKIVGKDTKVLVKGDDVIVTGINKEHVGQTAANIEQACKIKRKDPRKFLDGIYIYQKETGLAK